MPTYQYRCTECGRNLEAVQKFTDDALTECPECQGHLRKVFSAVGVVFKGSGFYRTDSRSASSSTMAAKHTTASASSSGDSSSKPAKSSANGSSGDSSSSSGGSGSSSSSTSSAGSTSAA